MLAPARRLIPQWPSGLGHVLQRRRPLSLTSALQHTGYSSDGEADGASEEPAERPFPPVSIPPRPLEENNPRAVRHQSSDEAAKRFGKQTPFQILSLDGGGVRGVFMASCLERLHEAHPTFLQEVRAHTLTDARGQLGH